MLKIIDGMCNFYGDPDCTDISLLGSKANCLIKLSKQCKIKNIFIGVWRGPMGHRWKLLGFDRGVLYG